MVTQVYYYRNKFAKRVGFTPPNLIFYIYRVKIGASPRAGAFCLSRLFLDSFFTTAKTQNSCADARARPPDATSVQPKPCPLHEIPAPKLHSSANNPPSVAAKSPN